MASSRELIDKQNNFINNKSRLWDAANNIKYSIDKLDVLIEKEKSAYTVDDISGSGSYLSNLREKQKNVYNSIVNDIIPSVDNKIDSLKYQIIDAKEQEELLESDEVI